MSTALPAAPAAPSARAPVSRALRAAWMAMLAFHFVVPIILSRWSHELPNEELYKNLAKNLAGGHYVLDSWSMFTRAGDPVTSFAPAWPACLAVGYFFAGPLGLWIVLGLVWSLAFVLADRLSTTLELPEWARWTLLVWFTTNPTLLYYHGHVMTEPLALALGLWIVAIGVSWLKQPSWGGMALLGLASAVGHLERTMLLLPTLAVLLVGMRTVPWRRFLPMVAIFGAVHLAVLSPWLWRMKTVGAGMTATELKLGYNLYQFSNPFVDDPTDPKTTWKDLRWPTDLEDKTPAARNAELVHLSLEGIRRDPSRYLLNCGRRLYFQLAPWPKSYVGASLAQAVGLTLSAILYMYGSWALFVAALRRGARLSSGAWVLLLAVALWYAGHAFIAGGVRMRIPSDPWVPALALAAWASRRRTLGDSSFATGSVSTSGSEEPG
jgi:hypothetical protein